MSSDNKRALLAVIISGLILFLWQFFFAPKTNTAAKLANQAVVTTPVSVATAPVIPAANTTANDIKAEPAAVQTITSQTLTNNKASYTLNSNLDIVNITNNKAGYSYIDTIGSAEAFSFEFLRKNVYEKFFFNLTKMNDQELLAKNEADGISIQFKLEESGKITYSLTSTNPIKIKFGMKSTKKELDGGHHREFSVLAKDLEKAYVGKTLSGEADVKWFGTELNFHLFALGFKNKIMSSFSANEEGTFGLHIVSPVSALEGFIVFTKKDYDDLAVLGDQLHLSVDYGIWSVIAVPILRGLQFFYKFIPNYGIAIILLTIVIRLLTFPLQYKSFKSMKKMQEIQPELTKLREKYKSEPQKLQKETMDLFKKAGANPLGGCLPLLLQMPIFFAFYKVLFNSTELMGAPFFGWIMDLSHKDPFYVLPVLMAGSMFLQQKLTPSPSVDPTQQKIMMFMPLVFGLIMKDLPAGLTLYIFVSTILGIAQQVFVMKRS